MNWIALLLSSIVPLLVGMFWYSEKGFGKTWMAETGMTREKAQGMNMPLIFGSLFVFSVFLSMFLLPWCIHQMHLGSLIANLPDPNGAMKADVEMMMGKYGNNFRTFKHGAFHGFLASIFIALPITAFASLFERKSWKLIFLHVGYWAVCFTIMGGIISAMK